MIELGPKGVFTSFEPPSGEVTLGSNEYRFPRTISEYRDQVKSLNAANRVFDAAELLTEATEAYWAERRLAWDVSKLDFFSESALGEEAPNIILMPGFGGWKGLLGDRLKDNKAPSWVPWAMRGTYESTQRFFEKKGARVKIIFPEGNINDGSVEETVELTAKEIVQAHNSNNGQVALVGHSLGGMSEYFLAARYPEIAEQVDHFFMVGSPLPVRVNSLVAEAFFYLRGGREFAHAQEALEYLDSPQSLHIKRRMHAWIADDDHVVKGPSPTMPEIENSCHSALLYNEHLLGRIISTVQGY